MNTLISHNSALEFWLLHRSKPNRFPIRFVESNVSIGTPTAATIQQAGLMGLSAPVEATVFTANTNRRQQNAKIHLCTSALPGGSMREIGNGLYVVSPELLYLQFAAELPMIKLIELGMELCGTYAIPVTSSSTGSWSDDNAIYGLRPISSIGRLQAYIDQSQRIKGLQNARTALQYIVENSASPMETKLTLLLTLPHQHGGYSLPRPELNVRVDLSEDKRVDFAKAYVLDLYWDFARVAVEYDSKKHHAIEMRMAYDSIRRNALGLYGIEVVNVTSPELRDTARFRRIAFRVADLIGKRVQLERSPGFSAAHRELRKLLL